MFFERIVLAAGEEAHLLSNGIEQQHSFSVADFIFQNTSFSLEERVFESRILQKGKKRAFSNGRVKLRKLIPIGTRKLDYSS